VYPGATHTRFAHSLGVYHIATKLIHNLQKKGASDWTSPEGILAFQIASLCHDLGHFPYTHALKELPLKDHEELTGEIVLNSSITPLIKKAGTEPEFVAGIVDKNIKTENKEILFYRQLLSGVLDPDKLDYLNRDAFYCGVPYGIQDTEFTLAALEPDLQKGITINSKSIVAVENLLFSKYLMYRTVYWHKTVRIVTAMMKKTLFSALKNDEISAEQLYTLFDESLFETIKNSYKKNPEVWHCGKQILDKKFYSVILELPFDEKNPNHQLLENLENRSNLEEKIASECGCKDFQVLIDIPEKISFESDLWIKDENTEFSKSSTVFTPETVKSFTEKLRFIRFAFDTDILNSKTDNEIEMLKKKIANFLI
jgi:HD superfamily phosphohydrolase